VITMQHESKFRVSEKALSNIIWRGKTDILIAGNHATHINTVGIKQNYTECENDKRMCY
jgi:hypothetical protein